MTTTLDSPQKQRFLALDIFRGLTICFMIIVNTSGNGSTTFAPLKHAEWIGFTPTDLVFPSFLFATGNALSFADKKWNTLSQSAVLKTIFKRSILMFLLGYLMYWFPFVRLQSDGWHFMPIAQTRIMGVLQRIAIAYCVSCLLVYYCSKKFIMGLMVFILLGYWFVIACFGDMTMLGNAVTKFDTAILGEPHLYHRKGIPFDPEGLLSTFPAIVNVIAGYFIGKYLQNKKFDLMSILTVAIWGFCFLSIAFMWNYTFPAFKKLWTSSFVLLTIGLDALLLVSVIYLVDLKKIGGKWQDFVLVFGKNPLVIYLFSELVATLFFMIPANDHESLYEWLFNHVFQFFTPYWGALIQAVLYMLLCWAFGWILDKKKIYIKL